MGVLIAIVIIFAWVANLFFCLNYTPVDFNRLSYYISIVIQTFLYTGLFITAHDSMHGAVSNNRKLNKTIGWIASILYVGMLLNRLKTKHFEHHKHPGTDQDPDYFNKSSSFFAWYLTFQRRYFSILQIIIAAGVFNLLLLRYNESQLLSYYVAPALLSSIQLFYFGIFMPHRPPHTNEMLPFRARTQSKGHLVAFLSCYFFGYHYEHHAQPQTPWWGLYRLKK